VNARAFPILLALVAACGQPPAPPPDPSVPASYPTQPEAPPPDPSPPTVQQYLRLPEDAQEAAVRARWDANAEHEAYGKVVKVARAESVEARVIAKVKMCVDTAIAAGRLPEVPGVNITDGHRIGEPERPIDNVVDVCLAIQWGMLQLKEYPPTVSEYKKMSDEAQLVVLGARWDQNADRSPLGKLVAFARNGSVEADTIAGIKHCLDGVLKKDKQVMGAFKTLGIRDAHVMREAGRSINDGVDLCMTMLLASILAGATTASG
jgi:hypothetical protein